MQTIAAWWLFCFYDVFHSLPDFLSAIEETVYQDKDTHKDGPAWRQKIEENYRAFFGKEINIPRWDEIKLKYKIK